MKKLLYALSCSSVLLAPGTANAYLIFFGEDLTTTSPAPIAVTSNSDTASASFKNKLSGVVSTETFEGIASNTPAPLTRNFTGAGTATLRGNGAVRTQITGTASADGLYSIPSPHSTNYWETTVDASEGFTIDFSESIAALGFYGIDVGDFGGQLELKLSNGDILTLDESTPGIDGSTDGSVLFFGVIAETAAEQFTDVEFLTTAPIGTDVIGIDQITIGTAAQIVPPNNPVPSPGTLALLGLGLAGLGWSKRKT